MPRYATSHISSNHYLLVEICSRDLLLIPFNLVAFQTLYEVVLERSEERNCKIVAVKPENFSILGDVTVSLLTSGCELKKSSVKIGGSPCQVFYQSNNLVTCFLKRMQPGFRISLNDLSRGRHQKMHEDFNSLAKLLQICNISAFS